MYANATFGGTCEIEEPKLFKCEPDFWKEEACQMSNELIYFTKFGEIQYFILPSMIFNENKLYLSSSVLQNVEEITRKSLKA